MNIRFFLSRFGIPSMYRKNKNPDKTHGWDKAYSPLSISTRSADIFTILLGISAILPAKAIEYTTTFEADLGGWTAIKGTSIFNWSRHTGGTHSDHTGPASAHEGDHYLYLEASRNAPAKTAYLESPNFFGKPLRVAFHYHLYGTHMGSLALETFDGNAWRTRWTVTGQQHANHYAPWTRREIDLSGQTVRKIRFKGTTGSYSENSQYRGDMAIDYLIVTTDAKPLPSAKWSESGYDIYYLPGNVGIGTKRPTADLAILGNLSEPLTGHVAIAGGSKHVTGTGTRFTQELAAGDSLLIGEEVFIVIKILNDIILTVDIPHTVGALNATAYTDSDLLSVRTGAEVDSLVVDKSGNVGVGTGNPAVKLDVAGGIRVGEETVCDANRKGTIRYSGASDEIEFCNGTAWTRVEGPMGKTGHQGLKGDKGNPGTAGLRGLKGEKGPIGPRGLKGEKGDKGDKGDVGPQGPKSAKGDKGDPGRKGDTGLQGLKGDTGLRGLKGDTGPQGPKGNTGATGPQGLKGDKGDKGDTGTRGPQGLPGDSSWSTNSNGIFYNSVHGVGIGKLPNSTYKLDVEGTTRVNDLKLDNQTACGKLYTDASGNVRCGTDANSGDITGVTAGTGLSGGGSAGAVTLNVNTAQIQKRVTGNCSVGKSIREIRANGTVVCEDGGPNYDSGWFTMQSQQGTNSFKQVSHNLGVYPSRVKVLVKAIDGANNGFIFEGSGSAQSDDDDANNYGGVVFAYDQNRVRIWAPDKNNNNREGSIVNVQDGWGGEVNSQRSHTAQVKVLVWK
uniref:Collagen triple helix repeat-containing protein n=1 Tax=Candidatus Kentrum sp. TUN TaxID=2126343 RepID=A0A451AVA0_9GAMM|nr:MAG: Collagen triple helix repeat-containing protein [Candidatus Kentron sp. TUN]